jgi:diphosphomevalonate decarboxylase
MPVLTATALAHPNIAFIKYWGNQDDSLRLPANGSISMNLDGLFSRTRVTFSPDWLDDQLILNDRPVLGPGLQRVTRFLDRVRELSGLQLAAQVTSENNFPTGAGIASSASAFAALALAASRAAGLSLTEPELSRLARRGSGSACRSVPGGFVEWLPGDSDESSFAASIAPPDHWPLVDCIAILAAGHKPVGSTAGHALAGTSPLQAARVAGTPERLAACRLAIHQRDFGALAAVIEPDSTLMHAVMMTSNPPLFYWEPASVALMKLIQAWRKEGLPACFTLDAGPNVHVICPADQAEAVGKRLSEVPGVQQVLRAQPGGPARLFD